MDDEVARWLADRAVPLDEVGLAAWRPALTGVRVLGVGAAAHGARELLQAGSRLVEFAVEELGVRVVALGTSEAGATGLDAVVRGVGAPGEAVAGLGGWQYDTREVVDLVSRLRDHNELLPETDRIRVVGVDPVRPALSVKALGGYLRAAAPDLLPDARDALADLLDTDPDARVLPARVRDAVVGLHGRMVAEEARLVAETSPARYREALEHAWILARAAEVACAPRVREPRDAEEAEAVPTESAPVLRARLAAEAVGRAAEASGRTPAVVFWGHDDQVRVGDPTTVGRHLRAALGEAYYAVAGLVGEGGTSTVRRRLIGAVRPRPKTLRLPRLSGTVEADLRTALGDEDRLVDLRAARDTGGPVARWAGAPTTTRRLGAVVDSGQLRGRIPLVPDREFDALAHVPRVHPAWIR
ncbi:erythromycin esterase family protein [Actinomycetospora sp. TBRC 11914]|uniref:erythromycin esterase family protein n=1 Tax=Actinomycetospora sp. TBRC 11914 TaxID=2729387 RepID=UPI00145EB810|nr:erythromycin esterase family protein [Actinomycetospora sp. TBRC 11914]NMO92508.1 erythromycin esterase family protein [Actinomycetospora sp. TBRC 11914]